MSDAFQPDLDFEATREAVRTGDALIVDLDAYEGPLDVLLALARAQKVDLMQVSIAKLADQYLAFIREARERRFSLAADYLVMAAWLAWLKSRLLLPKPDRGAGDLYELMEAYVSQRKRDVKRRYSPRPPQAYPLEDARERLRGMLPELQRWTPLTGVAPLAAADGPSRASFIASTLSATLEFVREGDLEARQLEHFSEIYLRRRKVAGART